MNMHVSPASVPGYTAALGLSLADKLFFADRLPDDVTVFVDFGCADGALLWATMQARFGRPGYAQAQFLGFDRDLKMLDAARTRVAFDPAFSFHSSFAALRKELVDLKAEGRKSCLILSSVVHEVLSEGVSTDFAFAAFWEETVRTLGCDYVAFRDMALENTARRQRTPDGWKVGLVAAIADDHSLAAKAHSFFVGASSYFPTRHDYVHFLLKAIHPDEDWERELGENYLPFTASEYLNRMTVGSGYGLAHYEHTSLPALRDRWAQDFGIYVPDNTHVKILLKKGA